MCFSLVSLSYNKPRLSSDGLTDESLRLLVALTVPQCEESVLESLLVNSELHVEAWAFDWLRKEGENGIEAVKEELSSVKIPLPSDPMVLVRDSEQEDQSPSLILIWETFVSLTKPRIRMPEPSISIYAVMVVTSAEAAVNKQDNTLEPFQPMDVNVLAAMSHTRDKGSAVPYLPASRLGKVLPSAQPSPKRFRIEHMSKKLRLVPAALAKMQYSRVRAANAEAELMASLNVELNPLFEIEAVIQELEVSIANGSITDLTKELLPLNCRSRDVITFLYRLHQLKSTDGPSTTPTVPQLPNFDVLKINLRAQIRVSAQCQPTINMGLTTNVDFFQALNPSYGGPSQPIQRHHRPPSLPLGHNGSQSQQSIQTSLQPIVNSATFTGVAISFTAPDVTVAAGVPFKWRVLVNNRSMKAVKLAIYPLPRMPRLPSSGSTPAAKHAPRMSTASMGSRDWRHGEADADVAVAVMDDNVLYAIQNGQRTPGMADLLSLTAELRIGSLGPGQCHEGEIEFIATRPGTFKVDSIRVVDLMREAEEGIMAPGVMVDIQMLPDIIARA
jgi:hypothetical protein